MFLGFVALEGSIPLPVVTKNSSGVPTNSDSLPAYRVYGPSGLMTNGTGSMALKNTGAITGATNASPIVITSANHGLTTGTRVTISGVGGNTAANGSFVITVINANTFSLNGSTGNSAYTSGGTWSVSGLYGASIGAAAANGFVQGQTYSIFTSWAVSSTSQAQLDTFTVV